MEQKEDQDFRISDLARGELHQLQALLNDVLANGPADLASDDFRVLRGLLPVVGLVTVQCEAPSCAQAHIVTKSEQGTDAYFCDDDCRNAAYHTDEE